MLLPTASQLPFHFVVVSLWSLSTMWSMKLAANGCFQLVFYTSVVVYCLSSEQQYLGDKKFQVISVNRSWVSPIIFSWYRFFWAKLPGQENILLWKGSDLISNAGSGSTGVLKTVCSVTLNSMEAGGGLSFKFVLLFDWMMQTDSWRQEQTNLWGYAFFFISNSSF